MINNLLRECDNSHKSVIGKVRSRKIIMSLVYSMCSTLRYGRYRPLLLSRTYTNMASLQSWHGLIHTTTPQPPYSHTTVSIQPHHNHHTATPQPPYSHATAHYLRIILPTSEENQIISCQKTLRKLNWQKLKTTRSGWLTKRPYSKE